MKRNENVHCNLCEKNFSDHDFKNHFSSKHFPKKKFTCYECDRVFQHSEGLLDHLAIEHFVISERLKLKSLSPKKLFKDYHDVIRHAKESREWIRFAFSYSFENPLSKKQLKSLTKALYLQEPEDAQASYSLCKFCEDAEATFHCYFCGNSFTKVCSLKYHILNFHLVLPDTLKAVTHRCELCSKLFQSKELLDQHQNEKHQHEQIKEKISPYCQYCGKCLANKSNLKRHILNQHGEEVGATPVNNVFTCHYCKCFFSNKSSVKRHIENLHLKEKDTRKSISCFQCEQRFNSIKNLNAHLTVEHDVQIHEAKVQFANLDEFWNWKKEEEIRTNSRFIQLRGLRRQRRKGEEISTLKFVCNRSGIFHSKSNGKRAYRVKGSSKIGRYCSAYIEIMFKDNASVDGTYCSTHSGHNNDLRYLALTMEEKREIYEKIKNGATFSTILNEIRNSVGKEIKRKHLVTNKDLHNIVTTFKKLSKPSEESSVQSESSSNDLNVFSKSDTLHNQPDRGLNNDLDICADLWVETCQRMINHFDQDQPAMSTVPELGYKEVAVKHNSNHSKNEFEKEDISSNRVKSDRLIISHDYSLNNMYPSNASSYSPLMQLVPSDPRNLWQKPQHCPSYSGQELDSETNSSNLSIPYQNGLSRSTSSNVRKDVHGEFGHDPNVNEDFYSSNPNLLSDDTERTSSHDVRASNMCPSTYYGTATPNTHPNSSVSCMRDIHAYSKTLNSTIPASSDVFSHTYMTPETDETICDDLLSYPEKPDDNADESGLSGIAVEGERLNKLDSRTQNESNNGMSDLRDRINSVTALYNIVESELDERKKNIIRNYVDNMFRVLQYRYNKCKTRKKPSTNQLNPQSLAQRRLNRRRGNSSNQLMRHKNTVKQKTKRSNDQKYSNPRPFPTSNFSAKSIDPYQNNFSNIITSDVRSEINLMSWDQY